MSNSNMTDKHRARLERIAQSRADLARRYAENPDQVQGFQSRMARLATARKREQERFDHLVIGKVRPTETITEGKKKGRRRPKKIEMPIKLSPGIEEAMQVREAHGYWKGTPETIAHAERTHEGALVQLHRNGTINNEQLEWAAEIANVHRSIESDVAVKVASLEARVDQSGRGGVVAESIKRVRLHLAYSYWREQIPHPKALVLDMIVGEAVGYSVAAVRHHVGHRRARSCLLAAINLWPACVSHAFMMIDRAMVYAANDARASAFQRAPFGETRAEGFRPARPADPFTPVAVEALLPPIDPDFLNDNGLLKEWSDIADIIRDRMFA